MRQKKHIERIEQEFGKPFSTVISDFAKDYSFSFTIQTLDLNKSTFKHLKPLFAPRKMQYQERPHVSKANLENARTYEGYTVRQIVRQSNLSRSTVYYRLKLGWSIEKILNTKPIKGNIANIGQNRNRENWKQRINIECELMKERTNDITRSKQDMGKAI